MQIVVTENRELIIPPLVCQILDVKPGDTVTTRVEDGCIVLVPPPRPPRVGKIIADPRTGFPVLDFGPDAPELTSEMVAEILSDFP